MRILLVADMRSPHSIGWVHGLTQIGAEPLVVSSRRLNSEEQSRMPDHVRRRVIFEPSDMLSRARSFTTRHPDALVAVRSLARRRSAAPVGTLTRESIPAGTGIIELPLELHIARELSHKISDLADEHAPDVIHALRVPFEGISVTPVAAKWPTAISIWGQDLVRQASASPRLASATRNCLASLRGLHADCQRDIDLAREWGAPIGAIDLLAPGNMGYDSGVFSARGTVHSDRKTIVCPRGPGSQVNYTGFLRVASRIAKKYPSIQFVGVALSGNAAAEEIRHRSTHPEQIVLTRYLSARELADVYRRSLAVVSPSVSDGTPVSVLTGMACGAIPIVGDIAPLRALLGRELPQFLFDPLDETAMEQLVVNVLDASAQQWEVHSRKAQTIAASGWSQSATFERVETWYQDIVDSVR